ncbi:hypothetical protein L9F63_005927 [Diploptera punctata]|uniref:Secreted protein n=1 Tax=Diploptera punctata TaxID=6984 RepID=A0AAD7ZBN8_DIPPU|nr:hypothetical protein L9F63_005927 [Diploptera punctata]
MASGLVIALIVSATVVQAEVNWDKREFSLPLLNLLDHFGNASHFFHLNKSLSDVARQAISFANETSNKIKSLANETIYNTQRHINKLIQETSSRMKANLENGSFANTVKGIDCLRNGTSAAAMAKKENCKKVIACIKDEANSFIEPVGNLIKIGENGVLLGLKISENLTSCFLHGFKFNSFDLMQNLKCAFRNIAPTLEEIANMTSSIGSNLANIHESFANSMNAITKCPMERMGELTIQLGDIFSNFGKCVDRIYKESNTTAPTNATSLF